MRVNWEQLLTWMPLKTLNIWSRAQAPEIISCRYNPGGIFELGTDIMDNPGEAKFGMTKDQLLCLAI